MTGTPPRKIADVKLGHARRMRRENAADVERELWRRLRNNQIGAKFRRQRPIGPYIVDFASIEAKLIIELDGGQHADQVAHDEKRTAYLESLGYRVLRFWNNDLTENIDGCLETILAALRE